VSERPPYATVFLDAMLELELLLRAETKETLVLFLAAEIAGKVINAERTIDRDAIAHELKRMRDWRGHARANNLSKRFQRGLERIRQGQFPKRRRRRRRQRTVTLGL
jgi:hypothetical protein